MGACCTADDTPTTSVAPGQLSRRADKPGDAIARQVGGAGGKPKLYYFEGYGRGEPIRMLLALAKVDYEDIRLTQGEFKEMKERGEFPSGSVPIWVDEKGRVFN